MAVTKKQTTSSPAPASRLRIEEIFSALDAPRMRPLDVLDADPVALGDPTRQFLSQIIDLMRAKNLAGAVAATEARRATDARNPALLNLLAALYLQNQDGLNAEKILLQAKRLAPDDLKITNNLACANILRKSWQGAEIIISAALKQNTAHFAELYYNLALSLFSQKKIDDAVAALVKGRAIDPLPEIYALFARIAFARGDSAAGIQLLQEGLKAHPDSSILQYYMAGFMMIETKWPEAISFACKATLADPENQHYAGLYAAIIQYATFDRFYPHHATAIACAAYNPGVNLSYLERAWRSLVAHLAGWDTALTKPEALSFDDTVTLIDTLKSDGNLASTFVCAGLTRLNIRGRNLELSLCALRAAYARMMAAGDHTLDQQDQDFLVALAHQCQHNGYVYFVSEVEKENIAAIRKRFADNPSNLSLFLVLCTYMPLVDIIPEDEALALASDMRFAQLVQFQIKNRRREFEIMEKMPCLTPIDDEISKLVEQMYVENPYPVWLGLNYGGDLEYLNLATNPKDRVQILIAGCGTGQHALMTALAYQNLQITAIDLSKRSLAYAQRMTEEYKIPNVTYAQADILGLGVLKQKFDSVESVGVLHHMKDPIKGLEVLLGLLKPGGILRLGLYSELARVAMVAGRNAVAAKGYPPTIEGIRQFRHDVMMGHADPSTQFLTEKSDFYTASTCRDLVFHVQEHRYTLPQVKQILADHNLTFRGFNLDPMAIGAFKAMFPNPDDLTNLDKWDEFEQNNPDTFGNMYQFWAQKGT